MSKQVDKILDENQSAVVMVVDDEEMVTKTLSTYLQLETDYEVLTFQSPQMALEQLRNKPVDLVISDFLMPEMDGLQFLGEVAKMHPNIARILLTGYADKENAIKAINEIAIRKNGAPSIPTGSAYEVKGHEYALGAISLFPSYHESGSTPTLQGDTKEIIAVDIRNAIEVAGGPPTRSSG